MSLPPALTRFLTRINRNGPVAWILFFGMNGIWLAMLLHDRSQRPNPAITLTAMLACGIVGLLIKKTLVWSGRFESSASPETEQSIRHA